ncbi:SGNH/GDSL hydrolase family protein [Treponema sp.]|uniref:SGNH/GDSL hydrolase family protein n=1 Tax=Treponema sp. TaxID=166 RepID=UPI00388F77EA
MNLAHLFEAGMLVCFGFSWPINVVKAYRAQTAKSTSLAFICLIITGYVAGITAKIINGQFNYVLAVYFLNLAIVFANVVVFFRNKALDRKRDELHLNDVDFKKFVPQKENFSFSNAEDYDYIPERMREVQEKKYNVVLLGGNYDSSIPLKQLEDEFSLDFELINKSASGLSVKNAVEFYLKEVEKLKSDGIIIRLGAEDMDLFKSNPSEFDSLYLKLLSTIKMFNSRSRIALVSMNNSNKEASVDSMNNHIKAIASSEQAVYVDLAYATLWNPKATKASVDFARNMGLNVKKPIFDVAKIIYSFAVSNIAEEKQSETYAG